MIHVKRSIFLLSALLVGLGAQGSAQAPTTYKIGATLPMTGPLASTGILINAAAQIGVDHVNRAGGVDGHKLELVTEDSQGSPQGGITAMRRLVQVVGVQAIFTMLTNVVSAQVPLADSLKVPFLTIAQAPGLVSKSPYSFAHTQTLAQSADLYRLYWNKNHVKRVYMLVPNNAVGPIIIELYNAACAKIGVTATSSVFNYGETDYRGLALRVKESTPDRIFLASSGGIDDTTIVKQIREAGVNVPIDLAANYWNDPTWQAAIGPYISNIVLADVAVDPKAGKQFEDDYRIKTGSTPSAIAALVYDSVKMFAAAIQRGGAYNGEAIAKQLAIMKGVPSVFGGTITMDSEHYSSPALYLYQVHNGKLDRIFSP
jgi:branched-chain amino acid transport system substrate-binding protein